MGKNKLTTAIKNWYRGKQAPPFGFIVGNETFESPWDGRYIQPLIVRLFKKIISTICLTYSCLIGFLRIHWQWIIIVLIGIATLVVTYLKN